MGLSNKKKTESDPIVNAMTVSEFFPYAVQFLHDEAAKRGFAKKGIILSDGLISIGNPFISAGLKSESDNKNRDNSFYLSLACSNMQLGMILARVLCTNRQYLISGQFYEEHEDYESLYKELLISLREDLKISLQEWESFRDFIVPKMLDLIAPFSVQSDFEMYRIKAVSAYYLLGVSIGLEKYEP